MTRSSENKQDIAEVSWEDVDEIYERRIEDIQRDCEKEISLKIGMSGSLELIIIAILKMSHRQRGPNIKQICK